jgi:hypothetical protein
MDEASKIDRRDVRHAGRAVLNSIRRAYEGSYADASQPA